jgi:hypothetical protein
MAVLSLPTLAGLASTVIFAASTLPMLVKAYRSRDLASYSLGNIALANLGNAVHAVYVYSLLPGPIWLLHTFYLVSSALMLGWFPALWAGQTRPRRRGTKGGSSDAERAAGCPGKVQPTGSPAESPRPSASRSRARSRGQSSTSGPAGWPRPSPTWRQPPGHWEVPSPASHPYWLGWPTQLGHAYTPGALTVLALAGLAIASGGALGPATWAAASKTITALHTE